KREYDRNSPNLMADLIMSIIFMSRASDEHKTRFDRQRKNWIAKWKSAGELKLRATSHCPAWLKPIGKWVELDNGKKKFEVQDYEEIPEYVDIVRRIYRECADGVGQYSIARRLNREGVPTFERKYKRKHEKFARTTVSWQPSYVAKILANKAVLGEYGPHTKPKGQK